MKIKKITSLILVTCLVFSMLLLASCSGGNNSKISTEDLSNKINSKLSAYATDLEESTAFSKGNKYIRQYLRNWAKSKDVDCAIDSANNVIMTQKTSEEYKDADPTVIICPYDSSESENYTAAIALSLYVIKNNESTGKLAVIFTEEKSHDFSGIKALDASYFTNNTKVICLNGSDNGQISKTSGGYATFVSTMDVEKTDPSYTKAYKVKISGMAAHQISSDIEDINTPLTRMRSLLIDLKSSNIGYEISYIKTNESGLLTPTSCEMIITIDSDKVQKFVNKMESTTTTFNEDANGVHPGATYTYEEVDTPDKVIGRSDSKNLVSYMQTMLNGNYTVDQSTEDENTSVISINYINTTSSSIVIKSTGVSTSDSALASMAADEEILCELSALKYSKGESAPVCSASPNSDFITDISKAYRKYSRKKLSYTDSVAVSSASFVKEKNNKCEIVTITVNDNVVDTCTGTIIEYLLNSNSKSLI